MFHLKSNLRFAATTDANSRDMLQSCFFHVQSANQDLQTLLLVQLVDQQWDNVHMTCNKLK